MNTMPWVKMAGAGFGSTTQHQKQIFNGGKSQKPNGYNNGIDLVDGGRHVDRALSSTPTSRTSEAAVQTVALNGNSSEGVPERVKKIARDMAKDVIHFVAQTKNSRPCSKYAKTMRRTVIEISERHNILFGSMVNQLQITEANAKMTFYSVFDEIFVDGQVNWGRVVAVYAFGCRMADYLVKNGKSADFIDKVAGFVGEYVTSKLGVWISENGGWDAFCDFFPEKESIEEKVWRGLWYTAFGLGAGVLATFVAGKS